MNGKHGWIVVGVASLAFLSGCNAPGGASEGSEAPAGEVFEVGDVDIPPRSTRNIRPQYPFTLAQRGIQASVELSIVVLADGSVGNVKVVSSTNREFDDSAIQAAKLGHYVPAILNDKHVACRIDITVEYNHPRENVTK